MINNHYNDQVTNVERMGATEKTKRSYATVSGLTYYGYLEAESNIQKNMVKGSFVQHYNLFTEQENDIQKLDKVTIYSDIYLVDEITDEAHGNINYRIVRMKKS